MDRKTGIYAWVEGYIQAMEDNNVPVTWYTVSTNLNKRYDTPIYRSSMTEIIIEMSGWDWVK